LQGSERAGDLPVELQRGHRVPVEPDLSIAGHPEVFAVGDIAWITDSKTQEVLPQLGSHAGNVEYLGLDEAGVLRLRLEQSGCSADTVRDLIERAVAGAAPEAAGVVIELAQPPAEPTLLQITRRPVGIQGTR